MRKLTIVVLAAAFALGACKKEEKGASDKADKKEDPAAKKEDPAAKKEEPTPTPTPTPTPEPATQEAPIAAAAPVVADDSITLGFTPPAVGAKWEEEQDQNFEMDIEAQGQKVHMKQAKVEKKQIEVLEVKDDAVTKAKYTYVTVQESQEMGGKKQSQPSPIEGKTYTLTAGTPTDVATDAGPAPAAEAEAVRDAEKKFGKSDRMSKMLAGKTFKKGEAVELPAAEVKEAMDDEDKMTLASMTLTFTGMSGDNANFDVKMMMGGNDRGNEMKFELTGKVVVDPKLGTPLEMSLSGPFTLTGQATGKGTMSMTGHRTK